MSSQPEQPTDFVRVGIERSDRMNVTEEHVWPHWVSRLLFGEYNCRSRIDSKARKSAHWQLGPHTRTRSGAQDGRILSTAGSDFPTALIAKERPMGSKRLDRRELLKHGAALAGGLTLGAVAPASAQTPASGGQAAASGPTMIRGNKELIAYGDRSHFVTSVRIPHGGRPSPDAFGLVFHVASPLQDSVGVITPSSLHYVATTRGSFLPDIDPREHRLMIHGMVDRPLTFTMEDLKRLPSVTRLHFIECAGNRSTPRAKNVQESHGMTSNAEWTGVLLSTLLKECGVKGGASWFVAEGAEEVKGASSMPLAKAMDDVIVAYGMNGEAVRPQNGFPLRLMVPGFEGIFSTKYVRRIKLVDRYYMNYNDYGHLRQDEKETVLGYQWGPKSVITRPSAGQQLPGKGFYEITGLAWSGGGAIKRVEVSTDDGKHWMDAEFKGTPQRMAHARFGCPWNWDGKETVLLSRCTDELGAVQPTRAQVAKFFNVPLGEVPGLDNTVQPWRIASDGSVQNGHA